MTAPPPAADAAERLKIAETLLAEARRGLDVQRAAFDGLRTRTGTVIAVTSLSATFLGARVLDGDRVSVWSTLPALAAFVASLGYLMAALWPLDLEWSSKVGKLADAYLAKGASYPAERLARDLAESTERMREANKEALDRRWRYFRIGIGLLGLQVAAWLGVLIYARAS